jgi:hypothetical protein
MKIARPFEQHMKRSVGIIIYKISTYDVVLAAAEVDEAALEVLRQIN